MTGNGWTFPIDNASALVTLPGGVPTESIETGGYTGPQGSKAQDLRSAVNSRGIAEFVTTKPLNTQEGLTIVVAWSKGYVTEPSASDKALAYYKDNSGMAAGMIGFIILLLYYLITWWIVGRDPAKETIIPMYLPPYGMSPAVIRFIREMGYDQKVFAATIINMAVKGYLWINEVQGKYTLIKGAKDEAVLDNDERAIAEILGLNRYGLWNLKIGIIPS